MKRSLLSLLLLTLPLVAFSTVEIVYKNTLFKELYSYVVEDSSYTGIGWEAVDIPEGAYGKTITELEEQGYRWSSFPYKMELLLFIAFVLLSGVSGRRYSKMLRYRRQHEEK